MQTESSPEDSLTLANVLVVLAIPAMAGGIFWGMHTLLDPLASVPPVVEATYPTVPKTLAQIQAELEYYGLYLGDRLDVGKDEVLYAVMERDFNGMRELRIYQRLPDQKLVLHRIVPIRGLDEFAVRSPVQKYALAQADRINPNTRQRWLSLPLTKLQLLPPPPQWQAGGVWLTATGSTDGILYGRILFYDQSPQKNLKILAEWTSPAQEIPQWRQLLPRSQAQLVVNQTQRQDPRYQVFLLETDGTLRQVNLPHSPKIRGLAEAGLWSLAKAHLDAIRAEGILPTAEEQEAYELVSAHAQILEQQMEADNLVDRIYFYVLNGRWYAALALVTQNPSAYPQISAMLAQNYPHLWLRVQAVQQFDPEVASLPACKTWGALANLPRLGFRRTVSWLREENAYTPENLSLLQKLDLQPLGIEPRQMVGKVRVLGSTLPDKQWFPLPPPLSPRGTWFAIEVDLLQTQKGWLSSPFPAIADRSPLFLWRTLGLEHNYQIRLTTSSNRQAFNLYARSLWVSEQGELQLLAEGDQAIAELLVQESHPALATTGILPILSSNLTLPISYLPEPLKTNLIANLYGELQAVSPADISLAEFQAIAQQWRFETIDFDRNGQGELFLTLSREQVNAGDRPYPLAIVFDQQGKILFSDIDLQRRKRRWLYNLSSDSKQPVSMLTEIAGRLELWQVSSGN
jgi:hypothetical protein